MKDYRIESPRTSGLSVRAYNYETKINWREKIMTYCRKCGTKNDESSQFCINCGNSLRQRSEPTTNTEGLESNDKTLIFLGNVCISPLLGIILYFVWKDNKPQKSKEVCSLTWWALGLWLLLIILFVIIMVIAEA